MGQEDLKLLSFPLYEGVRLGDGVEGIEEAWEEVGIEGILEGGLDGLRSFID